MTNPFQAFLAARAKTPKPVANAEQPVTRAEFAAMSAAVLALIEDFETIASPDKIKTVVNEAFEAAAKDLMPIANELAPSRFTAPRGDDELGDIMPPRPASPATLRNAAKPGFRAPLALKGE